MFLQASMDQIDILDENFAFKEKLVFQVGEIIEKITCSCVSSNESNTEELVIILYCILKNINLIKNEYIISSYIILFVLKITQHALRFC